jgi:AbrB family looped-hinge helix DNA binding protein
MRKVVKQLRHGQITIPKELREAIGLDEDDMLSITVAGEGKGSPWAKELYEMFAPVRGSLTGRSEEEVNKAIDEALRETRETKG